MLRGMHYMCWYKGDWNYHPSMMAKRLQQVEDIETVHGNMLLWSCLGSGAIGIPYLEREAFEPISPRFRFYGYLNDSEFCRECEKRDITAYAVLWKAQLWEFPGERAEDGALAALNKLRGEGEPCFVGMSELSRNQYPALFRPVEEFFPERLSRSDGSRVSDFLEDFAARTLEGSKILSSWLMVPGHGHRCYTPCGNNPAYMEYMKKLLSIMIDAGAGGVLMDEYDVQFHALGNAGCFCPDCMFRFREFLRQNPSPETEGLDLDTFDYREFLLSKGFKDADLMANQLSARLEIPLFRQFTLFNLQRVEDDMRQVRDFVKAYSREKRGREIPVTANLYNCLPKSQGLRKYCDVICGEKGGIKLRQDAFYRFGYAYMSGKEGSFIEDPDDHILQILEDIDRRIDDAYMLFMLEPLSHGFNIAISYGGWLMNFKKDSFYPNLETEKQIGDWLAAHENLFQMNPAAQIAVVYDQRSALDVELFSGNYPDPSKEGGFRTFFDVTQELCNRHILYNVLYCSDDEPLTAERLAGYDTLLLPDVYLLPQAEKEAVRAFPGRKAAVGRVDRDFFDLRRPYTKFQELAGWLMLDNRLLWTDGNQDVGVALHRTPEGWNLHLLNYRLDNVTRRIQRIPSFQIRLGSPAAQAIVHSFPHGDAQAEADGCSLTVRNLDIVTVVEIKTDK
ncbi:MAG: hypothetical protein HFG26_05085 [Provencibacterium sp.]|jgi:hypothetical protein|nr:hypothetical protein [Provencibacterium sp.]